MRNYLPLTILPFQENNHRLLSTQASSTQSRGEESGSNQPLFDLLIHQHDPRQREHFHNAVFNQTQVPKRKLHLSPNEVFNQINTPHIMEQTRLFPKSNELTPPEWRESTRNKLTPPLRSTPGEKITPTPLNHEMKKNVQFQEPIANRGQVGNKRVYDPILITPKHYYNPSSSEGHPDPN